jgi:hypothetical protein
MSRIESPALCEIESRDAARRAVASTEALVTKIIAFQKHAVARKGGDPNQVSDTEESRMNLQLEIGRCAAYATGL